MQPLMNRRDYDSYTIPTEPTQGPGDAGIKVITPEDYDSPIIEEEITEPEEAELRCPFCMNKSKFNHRHMKKVNNFSCPSCAGKVPSTTLMKQAGNEYISSIELVSDDVDENGLVEDLKDGLKVIKKIDKEDKK